MGTSSVPQRTKTSAVVVEYVQREIFEGRLRCGDRIYVERLAAALDVSPTPVREALVLLERDGLVSAQVHRATFVQHFDARTLRADFHVLGLLGGVAAARVALDRDPRVLEALTSLLAELASSGDLVARRQDVAGEILRLQNRAGATPRLRAELHGYGGFLGWAAAQCDRRGHAEIVEAHRRVIEAIVAGDPRLASRTRLADATAVAEQVVGELTRRGVLRADGTNSAVSPEPNAGASAMPAELLDGEIQATPRRRPASQDQLID
ncbi:GntR family transcriptional regulator [Frankia sp. AiPs1]|uniref:GntR family transcriptional regulator n=1 Tax=Frankia sp. AiPa1 TaxID=573492 RepID=UPI00202B9F8A|nr:GntR family transcriptional regulator [Frankia sp. AiPa1]MCL9762791.1 GntR family transcriptional regulator [Frankia sp. AiPa1]